MTQQVDPLMARVWHGMEGLPAPRNVAAIRKARESGDLDFGGHVVLSLIGPTDLPHLHLFVDPGRRYDLRSVTGLFGIVATRPGLDAGRLINDLRVLTQAYVTLVDYERQVVASVVDAPGGGAKLWQSRRGGEVWRSYFG